VWWAGTKTIEVYLGQRISMMQTTDGKLVKVTRPAALPLQIALEKLSEQAKLQGLSLSACFIKVLFDANLCKGIAHSTSSTKQNLRFDSAERADATGSIADSSIIKHDVGGMFTATLNTGLLKVIHDWAVQHRSSLHSVQPLWAYASHAQIAQSERVKAIMVAEPGCLTYFAPPSSRLPQGLWRSQAITDSMHTNTLMQNWLIEHALHASEVEVLVFEDSGGRTKMDGLTRWNGHWRQS
jgi:hypothetical protein